MSPHPASKAGSTEPNEGIPLEGMIQVALDATSRAAELLLEGYRNTDTAVSKKGALDLVTEYDLKSERLICAAIRERFPEHRLIAEEGTAEGGAGDGEISWYIDPIDGTTNYAHGHPFFCISIGVWKGSTPILAVVDAPALHLQWRYHQGKPTERNGEPCQVSTVDTLGDALCASGFPYNRRATEDDNSREFFAFMKCTQGMRRCGSAALDLAMVADGTLDFYWEKGLKPWDVAAGIQLVRGSGGSVTDTDGNKATPYSHLLVASNGTLHQEVTEKLRSAAR